MPCTAHVVNVVAGTHPHSSIMPAVSDTAGIAVNTGLYEIDLGCREALRSGDSETREPSLCIALRGSVLIAGTGERGYTKRDEE